MAATGQNTCATKLSASGTYYPKYLPWVERNVDPSRTVSDKRPIPEAPQCTLDLRKLDRCRIADQLQIAFSTAGLHRTFPVDRATSGAAVQFLIVKHRRERELS